MLKNPCKKNSVKVIIFVKFINFVCQFMWKIPTVNYHPLHLSSFTVDRNTPKKLPVNFNIFKLCFQELFLDKIYLLFSLVRLLSRFWGKVVLKVNLPYVFLATTIDFELDNFVKSAFRFLLASKFFIKKRNARE